LKELDPQLLCDPARSIIPSAPTVVDLARKKAAEALATLPAVVRKSRSGCVS